MLINNVTFTVVGVAPAGILRRRSGAKPDVYLPMHAGPRVQERSLKTVDFDDPNYYWVEMMGRLKPGVDLAQAQAALARAVRAVGRLDGDERRERANLPSCISTKAPRASTP